ncbi:hypothetical protein R4369_29395 [Rhodococcus opacus]|nr:hypothetical protein [Rhodococcus opacus]MDV7088287.1 hypothetical protein [Rhodococcus opacus]
MALPPFSSFAMSSMCVMSREVGPEMLMTEVIVLLRSLTGVLTEVNPISTSSLATEYPCARSLFSFSRSSSRFIGAASVEIGVSKPSAVSASTSSSALSKSSARPEAVQCIGELRPTHPPARSD